MHRGPTGESRSHNMPKRIIGHSRDELADDLRPFRPWTDQRDVALQKIPYLWKFIKPSFSQKFSCPCNAFIIFLCKLRPAKLGHAIRRECDHRAKFAKQKN